MTWRKLHVLIGQLPPESALSAALRKEHGDTASVLPSDPDSEQWSRAEQLLAAVKDELTALRWAYQASKSKHRPKWKPEPTPRPGVRSKRKRPRLSQGQVNALELYLDRVQGAPDNN